MKFFGTDGVRGKANEEPMTPTTVTLIGKAIARNLKNNSVKNNLKILIGKDTRLSNYMLEMSLASGILSEGVKVLFVGPVPTPAVAHLTKSFACNLGIMLTASHNHAFDTGIKIFNSNGFKLSISEEKKIEALINSKKLIRENIVKNEFIGRAKRIDDASGRYIEYCKSTINNHSLKRLKIVVDCANGASYKIAPTIFEELGARVIVLNNKPNGLNINLNCGALNLEELKKTVVKEKANCGFAFDGDADRVMFVDEKGKETDGDFLLAIISKYLMEKNELKNNSMIATIMSNQGLIEYAKKNKIKLTLTRVGDKQVIEEMLKQKNSLGGEQSGHIIFSKHSTTGDGIITALNILKIMKEKNKSLSELKKIMKKYPQVLKNLKVKQKKPLNLFKNFQSKLKKFKNELGENGRILVRYSGTEPLIRIMVEGKNKTRIETIAEKLIKELKKETRA